MSERIRILEEQDGRARYQRTFDAGEAPEDPAALEASEPFADAATATAAAAAHFPGAQIVES